MAANDEQQQDLTLVEWEEEQEGQEGEPQEQTSQQPVTREVYKETIREIVKIRCRYCGNTFEERADRCPHCGAPS